MLSGVRCEIVGAKELENIFAGCTLDYTRANRATMNLLEDEHPTWACVGCSAHGGHLLMKDLCKHSCSRGRTAVQWGVKWLADVNKDANTIADYLNDSSTAKALLCSYQQAVYRGNQQITVSVPAGFAPNLFVTRSLQNSKAALLQASGDPKWDDFGGKATGVGDVMVSPMFWTLLGHHIPSHPCHRSPTSFTRLKLTAHTLPAAMTASISLTSTCGPMSSSGSGLTA
jgi:hypothetical protein